MVLDGRKSKENNNEETQKPIIDDPCDDVTSWLGNLLNKEKK
jgi:hypothetical protein